MTVTDLNQGIDPLEREAIAWVRRLTSGEATAADAAALDVWRGQSAAHAAAFSSASRLWSDLEPAGRNWRQRDAMARRAARASQPHSAMSRRILLGGGLAAASAAAIYAVAHPPMGLWPSWTEMRADYRTKTGEQRDIMLAAGMSVRMNTQTSIAIRHSDENTERVELVGGEASFSTSAGGARALAVLAADGWITADMAQFDVRFLDGRTGRSVCVTCLKGTLKVERGRDVTTITTGQQLRYRGGDSERVDAVDPELISAWQRGVLIFRFTPLQDAVSEINRYRPGLIVVVNPQLGRLPVSGRFRIDDLNEILARIEEAFGAKVRSLPGGLVLLS